MNIKKKLAMGVVAAALGISLISGGTFAYFSDVEVTNNTFAAGTLDINLKTTDDREEVNISVDNMKPGDKKVHQIRIYNEGSLEIKDVKLNVDYSVNDAAGDNGDEDFADHILVHIMTNSREVITDWVPLSEIEDLVVAEDLKTKTGRPYQTTHREVLIFNFRFHDNGEDQNIFQGDSLDFNLVFEASQKDGEYR